MTETTGVKFHLSIYSDAVRNSVSLIRRRQYSVKSTRCIHCHSAILSVHQEQLDAVDLMAVAQEFVKRYRSRERIFGKFLLQTC